MKRIVAFFLLLLCFTGCVILGDEPDTKESDAFQSKGNKKDFDRMSWLEGNWTGEADNITFYENWVRESGTSFSVVKYNINEAFDTVVAERKRLYSDDKGIYYANEKTAWKLGRLGDSSMVFYNDELDSSNAIRFRLTRTGLWVITIRNTNNLLEYQLQKVSPVDKLLKEEKQKALEDSLENIPEQ
jgi:hypothetical protein